MDTNEKAFQFTLVGLLLAMAVVAAALAVLVAVPPVLATPIIIFLFVAVPALLTTRIVYGCGYQRTFCIGALFPAALGLYVVGWLFSFVFGFEALDGPGRSPATLASWIEFLEASAPQFRVYAGAIWTFAVVIGMLCVVSHWAIDRRGARKN